jgi:hypothetical protein
MDTLLDHATDHSSLHRYRTEIPNLVDDMGLSAYAFRVYAHLKRVADDAGSCSSSARQLAQHCCMSASTVSKAKQELVAHGLIRITRDHPAQRDQITLIDLWPANFAHCGGERCPSPAGEESEGSTDEPAGDEGHALVYEVNTPDRIAIIPDRGAITHDRVAITPDRMTITQEEPEKTSVARCATEGAAHQAKTAGHPNSQPISHTYRLTDPMPIGTPMPIDTPVPNRDRPMPNRHTPMPIDTAMPIDTKGSPIEGSPNEDTPIEDPPMKETPASVALRATGGSGYRPKEEKEKAEKAKAQHDVTAAYEPLKQQPFWQINPLSLQTLVKEIPALPYALLKGGTHQGMSASAPRAGRPRRPDQASYRQSRGRSWGSSKQHHTADWANAPPRAPAHRVRRKVEGSPTRLDRRACRQPPPIERHASWSGPMHPCRAGPEGSRLTARHSPHGMENHSTVQHTCGSMG